MKSRSGISVVQLGISIMIFSSIYAVMFLIVPMVLGAFFNAMPTITNSSWNTIYNRNQTTIQFLIPLMPTIILGLLVLKVLLNATNRGND